jgi:hypothetical protein
MFGTIMLAVRGKAWFVVRHTLFKLVPIRPTVPDGVVLQNILCVKVLLIRFIRETMECLALIFLSKLFYMEHIHEEIIFVGFLVLCFEEVIVGCEANGVMFYPFPATPERPAHYDDAREKYFFRSIQEPNNLVGTCTRLS